VLGGVPELCIVQNALKQALASQLLSHSTKTHTHTHTQATTTQKIKNYGILRENKARIMVLAQTDHHTQRERRTAS
jgi:hypothetical protein